MALRIIELDIDESISGDTRVEEIALVLQPAIETEFMYFKQQNFETYNDYPEAAKNNACKVLRWRDEHGEDVKGMTSVGWIRANQLCGGENISEETIARMSSFQRHRENSEIAEEYKGTPWKDAGYVAWLGWGGTEGIEWAQKKLVSIREEMGYDTSSLSPYVQTTGTTENFEKPCYEGYEMICMKEKGGKMVPNCVPIKGFSLSQYDLDVFGYKTKYFEICPGAQATFKDLVSIKPTEDSIGMIRSAAVVADSVFKIEDIVLKQESATQEQLDEATVLVEDFKDIIGELEKIYNKKYDVSYMDNHIKTIESYVGKEGMAEIEDCGCDCGSCDDSTYPFPEGGLYFGRTMINGMPVFQSADEAATYAQVIGCSGSHEHMVDGQVVYMPCDIHNPEINESTTPEILELLEDRGVELEDLLKQGWVLEEVNQVDSEKIRKEMAQKFNKMKPEQFVQIITTPNEVSSQDLGNRRFRYVYMVGFGSEIIETSREMCRRMLGGRQFVFRYEDIVALSAALESAPNSMKLVPRPKGTSVDCFQYKMGANCRHYWLQLVFDTGIRSITSEQNEQPKITNNKRRMIEDANLQIPAPNMAGMVNPPVDYGSRSPQSVGLSKQDFRRSSSSVVIVDVDDTLVRGNSGIKKTIDYVNKKWENNRIVIVSARPVSSTESTKRELDRLGVKWDDIYLSDFPQGPNSGNAFKGYKAKKLQEQGLRVVEAIDNSSEARREYDKLGIVTKSPTSLKALPAGFIQGLAVFKDKEDAKEWSFGCGCGGDIEEVDYLDVIMFQACSYKKQKMSAQFSVDQDKRMIYSPAMKPGILIPRLDEVTREKYFVTFKPDTIERMAQRFLIEGRTNKTNLEHTDIKFEDVFLVESWIVSSDQDKAYSLGYTKEQVPVGTWMVGFKVDNDEVWNMVKEGKVKGLSIEGNFEYKFSSTDTDEYLLKEIINILNQIN
jgi:hypothetical protein